MKSLSIIGLFGIYLMINSCSKIEPPKTNSINLEAKIPHKSQNLIVITLDGYRWEEVFRGADSALLFNPAYTNEDDSFLVSRFWSSDLSERRTKISPFFWNELVHEGKLFGNRDLGNKVNVTNPYWKSYPGYNEIFTGYGDPRIDRNHYGPNPNKNILEFINSQPGFQKDTVSAFCIAKGFYDILNVARSGLNVTAGRDLETVFNSSPMDQAIFESLPQLNLYNGIDYIEYDKYEYAIAKGYLQRNHPRVLYISFFATDKNGHRGHYDVYLKAAYNINVMIGEIWHYIQSDPFYKDKTTLFITTDHGRGVGADWRSHGATHPHSDEIWFAAIGPDTQPLGEISTEEQLYQNQFATSMAAFLGFDVKSTEHPMGLRIQSLMDRH